jgi:hypothetical protein
MEYIISNSQELHSVKDLVMYVMDANPDTRNNDTLLYLECCTLLGAESIQDIEDLGLNIVTVHKARQRIQNKFKTLMPDENIESIRKSRYRQIYEYM